MSNSEFVNQYLRMVYACAHKDRQGVIEVSPWSLWWVSKEMVDAHVEAGFIVGEPFSLEGRYDFEKGNIAGRVSELAAVMLKHRLVAPPKEVYTLHRKLSGAFLTCKKLRAYIPCRSHFLNIYYSYSF